MVLIKFFSCHWYLNSQVYRTTGMETRQAWSLTCREREEEGCVFRLMTELRTPAWNFSFDFHNICSEGILPITRCPRKFAHKAQGNKQTKSWKEMLVSYLWHEQYFRVANSFSLAVSRKGSKWQTWGTVQTYRVEGCGEGTALQAEKKHSMEVTAADKPPVAESVCTFHCWSSR